MIVPSIMSPETTTNSTPASDSLGIIARRASSPARLLRATGRYSGIVSTERMKCAWWLVTNTTRAPGAKCGNAVSNTVTWASRLSVIA